MKKVFNLFILLLLSKFCHATIYSFIGCGNWSDSANWVGRNVPPNPLTEGNTIAISPQGNCECVLDVAQTLQTGATLIVLPGYRFRILGDLIIEQPVPTQPGDSIYVLTGIGQSVGGSHTIDYDTVHGRYRGIYQYYSSISYDSTFLFYDTANRLSYTVGKSTGNNKYYITVLSYGTNDTLTRIYSKMPQDIGNYVSVYDTSMGPIYTVDSLKYDSAGRLFGSYKWNHNSDGVTSLSTYYLFYYMPTNDSLLSKVEYYADNPLRLFETFSFFQYDTNPNPFYPWLKYHGLLMINIFYQLPAYYTSSYMAKFATFSPHNAIISTGAGLGPFSYLYNEVGLPTKCYKNSEAVVFGYKKVKKPL